MNLITYLTEVIHEDLKTAAKNVNTWIGVTTLMPLVGGFIADAYTGRFHMVQLSSVIYLTVNIFHFRSVLRTLFLNFLCTFSPSLFQLRLKRKQDK